MSKPQYSSILLEVGQDGVALLTFNRPEKRNALDQTMVDETRAALNDLAGRADLRVVIFTGAGEKAFISGADIAQLRDRKSPAAFRRINTDLFREIERFPAPTIAAVRGYALGGGCELALACDLRVCGEGARFGQPEVGLGIIPGAGATYRLPRLVGLGRAKELIYTGRIFKAGEALQMGLVNRVVPDAQVLPAARELAGEIAQNSGLAVRLAKQSLNQSADHSLDALQALESTAQAVLFDDPEKVRRMTDFLEKRAQRAKTGNKQAPAPVLTVCGAAELQLGFDQLLAFPAAAQVPDVSALIKKRSGQAVRLMALLERAGATPGGKHVHVTSSDGEHGTSQPVDVMERAVIVYALHGKPLPEDQGGPFRLLIPDPPDTCANIKQVCRVELAAEEGRASCGHSPEQHAAMKSKPKS